MRLICKEINKKTKLPSGKEVNQTIFQLELDNGRRVDIKPFKNEDYAVFKAVATFEKLRK